MRALLVLAFLPVLLAGAAFAQNATDNSTATGNATATSSGPTAASVTMHAHVEGDTYYWTQGSDAQRNPTLSFAPGTQVTVTVVDESDQTHNFAVAPDAKGSPYVNGQGDQTTYTFTMPSSDTTYFCVPHKSLGMGGKITVAGASTGGAAAGGNASAPAPTPAPTSFTIVAHAEGDSYFWTLEGQTQHNPTITVAPDTTITVTVKNSGDVTHNFAVGDDKKGSAYLASPADVVTYTFQSGHEGESSIYFCVPHGSLGMKGTLKFAKEIAPPTSSGGGGATSGVLGTGSINGDAVDLGQASGDGKCGGMQIPAPVADKQVGGPTVADYQKRCDEGGAPQEGLVTPSNADYVIPVSLGVIGLGVVGVVWVHKFYRP
ncbi:MAG: hypothetical protein QOE90_760 [Thermoplasmata archaeon]|nr:hypothetical protein [Thermoplasmata archaeon]